LFEIRLDLNDKSINFEPPIEESTVINSTVTNTVKGWISDFC